MPDGDDHRDLDGGDHRGIGVLNLGEPGAVENFITGAARNAVLDGFAPDVATSMNFTASVTNVRTVSATTAKHLCVGTLTNQVAPPAPASFDPSQVDAIVDAVMAEANVAADEQNAIRQTDAYKAPSSFSAEVNDTLQTEVGWRVTSVLVAFAFPFSAPKSACLLSAPSRCAYFAAVDTVWTKPYAATLVQIFKRNLFKRNRGETAGRASGSAVRRA